jgi:MFS family permease
VRPLRGEPRAPLPRPVKVLGLVSLLTDASSEMIYPLLPAFLTGPLRAGPAVLGLIEGMAEATASLLKIVSGALSDRASRRKPFVVFGYSLSTLARPAVALAATPWHVLAVRLADRVGKGVRSAPRDALLAEATAASERGRAYGFHRAMDHAGALVGPLLASAVLLVTAELRVVFALALLPGLAALAVLAFGVKEAARTPEPGPRPVPSVNASIVGRTSRGFRAYLVVLALFTLGNSSDAFLLLKAQQAGVGLPAIPLLWAFHSLAKASASTHGGALSDRLGRRLTIVLGWSVYAVTYAGFALAASPGAVWALFALYGAHHALTEGAERALVADLAGPAERGRAFGLYHGVTGAMLLPASLLTGWIWHTRGAATALSLGAVLAGVASFALLALVREPRPQTLICEGRGR